jgi:hypothetical protein
MVSRVYFTQEEDSLLQSLVEQHGINQWALIADILITKSVRQLKERWEEHLCPNINKEEWTVDEDQLLLSKVSKFGKKWMVISRLMEGRTDGQCKNRYKRLLRCESKTGSFLIPKKKRVISKTAKSINLSATKSQDTFSGQFNFFSLDFIPSDPMDNAWMQGYILFDSELGKSSDKNL